MRAISGVHAAHVVSATLPPHRHRQARPRTMSARIVLPVVLLLRHRHVHETVEPLASTRRHQGHCTWASHKATAHGHRTRPLHMGIAHGHGTWASHTATAHGHRTRPRHMGIAQGHCTWASHKATAHGHRTRPGNHASLNLCVYRSVTNGLIGKTQVAS